MTYRVICNGVQISEFEARPGACELTLYGSSPTGFELLLRSTAETRAAANQIVDEADVYTAGAK